MQFNILKSLDLNVKVDPANNNDESNSDNIKFLKILKSLKILNWLFHENPSITVFEKFEESNPNRYSPIIKTYKKLTKYYKNFIQKYAVLDTEQIRAMSLQNKNQTLLHTIAANQNPRQLAEIVKLIEHGCNVNTTDIRNDTPLHYAASINNVMVLEILLLAEAKINATSITGETPLDIALMFKGKEAVEFLQSNGAETKDPYCKHYLSKKIKL